MNINLAAANSITLVLIIVGLAVAPVTIYALLSWFKDRRPW